MWLLLSSNLSTSTNVKLLNRRFEMGYDFISDHNEFEIIGAYFSPVSDAYAKPGLAPAHHRVKMCELAVIDSNWIMVDPWEATQTL
jgi:nicotinamide mononucleotide adenylyltransferase